ncbi:MAG: hypothetical protein ACRBC3_08315 [Burkholderiaceae bacterium]
MNGSEPVGSPPIGLASRLTRQFRSFEQAAICPVDLPGGFGAVAASEVA